MAVWYKLRIVRPSTAPYIPTNAALHCQTNLQCCQNFWPILVLLGFLEPIGEHLYGKHSYSVVPPIEFQCIVFSCNTHTLLPCCIQEFLPLLLGNRFMEQYKLKIGSEPSIYSPAANPSILNGFATAAFRNWTSSVQGSVTNYGFSRNKKRVYLLNSFGEWFFSF